jgi:hypothetical protein
MSNKKKRTIIVVNYRNAIDGTFVTEEYAKKHPRTTTKEHNKKTIPAKKSRK